MKVTSIVSVLALSATTLASPKPKGLPTTTIAGVEVVDTQIVRDAQKVIQKFPDYLYHHCMRTWLYGAAAINANKTLKAEVDLEAHALGTILHDLGWDST
jgi:HD superfamily phosphodiesterase